MQTDWIVIEKLPSETRYFGIFKNSLSAEMWARKYLPKNWEVVKLTRVPKEEVHMSKLIIPDFGGM